MATTEDKYEYELIDISFSSPYDIEIEEIPYKVCEDSPSSHNEEENKTITRCDNDGIPMGRTKEEIKKREKFIKEFYAQWISAHPDKKVWNKNLNSYILVKFTSINETYSKAARSYESTKAVFRLTEILENAELVSQQTPKPNNKNQKPFSRMLIMIYEGIKLTVGFQRKTSENVQYSITAPNNEKSHP